MSCAVCDSREPTVECSACGFDVCYKHSHKCPDCGAYICDNDMGYDGRCPQCTDAYRAEPR
jgi:hypothetical protein